MRSWRRWFEKRWNRFTRDWPEESSEEVFTATYVCMYVCMYSYCRVSEARVLIVVAIVVIVIVVMMAVEEIKIGVIASVTIAVGLSRELEF